MKFSTRPKLFTLIELLIVISIIGVIISISFVSFSNVRQKGRDTKRIADIKLIQKSLEDYYRDEGLYPDTLTPGQSLTGSSSNAIYMQIIPQNPTPRNDGVCPDSEYSYQSFATGTNYKINFCLSETTAQLSAGEKCATAVGINDGACPPPLAGLKLWLNAGVGITKDGSDLVSQWNDQSGNSNNAVQATGENQPLWLDNQLNGQPTLRFDGQPYVHSDFLRTAPFTLVQPETIFMAFNMKQNVNGYITDGNTLNTMILYENTGGIDPYAGAHGAINYDVPVDSFFIITGHFSGVDSYIQVNNGTPVIGDAGTSNAGGFTIGASGDNGYAAKVDVAEILIYDHSVTDSEKNQVLSYLNSKYSIY